jgi:nitroreductase
MLLAPSYGLGTIALAQAMTYPEVIRKALGIPDSLVVVLGIAIGYPDLDKPVNKWQSPREPMNKVVKWYGFE